MPPYVTAFFTNSGIPATGLSPTISIWRTDTGALVINEASMTEIAGGFYKYDFSGYDQSLDYVFRCDGTSSIPNVERYAAGDSFDLDNTEDILDDTGEMQGKLPTNNIMGSSVKTDKDDEIDAIKAKTDVLTFNGSNVLSEDQSPKVIFQPVCLGGFDYFDYAGTTEYPVFIKDANGRVALNAGHITTPGSFAVIRYRQNNGQIVQSGVLTIGTTNGLNVHFDYTNGTPPNDIRPGDSVGIAFIGTVVTVGGQVFEMPTFSVGPLAVSDTISEPGTVQALSTTLSIITDITGPGDDTYKNMQLRIIGNFGGSAPVKLTRLIKSYTQSTGTFIVEPPFPVAPSEDDIVIVESIISENLEARDRLLALMHENIYVENTYDAEGNHTGSTVELYDTKANANTHDGSTGLLASYTLTVTYEDNKAKTHLMVKD